jgi:hypothetical protein
MRYPLAATLAIWAIWAAPPIRADEKPHPYADELRRQADALIASAVKRPYGWGWSDVDPDEPAKKGKPAFVPIAMNPGETPAAGLVLFWAGKLQNEPRYADAARQVARGLAAAQMPVGRFYDQALFGATSAGGKETPTPLPDRGPTRAAMALLLTLAAEAEGQPQQEPQQESINRAGSRAAAWLLKQQAETGAWPVFYPPDVPPQNATRVVRLETPETRDCVLTMLLAYETLGDPFQRRSVERSLAWLLKARSGAGLPIGGGLWQSAYTPVGQPLDRPGQFTPGYDLLASRYSAQTFLSVYTLLGDGPRLTAAETALRSIDDLIKGDDGRWHRRYNFRGGALLDGPPSQAADATSSSDAKKADAEPPPPPPSDPGLAPLAETVAAARQLGREKFREHVKAGFAPREHLAIVLAGLGDDPMSADWPTEAGQVEAYLKRIEASPPTAAAGSELSARVRRLWVAYLRARLEKELGV